MKARETIVLRARTSGRLWRQANLQSPYFAHRTHACGTRACDLLEVIGEGGRYTRSVR